MLAASCLAKPSFAFVALPAWAVITVYLMFRQKSIKPGIRILLPTLPAVGILLLQYVFNFMAAGTEEHREMSVAFGSYAGFSAKQVFMVTLAMCFLPVLYGILSVWHKEFTWCCVSSLLILICGWLEMFFLTDGNHGNFSWGWDLAVWCSTIIAVGNAVTSKKMNRWWKCLIGAVYMYQLYSGLVYFVKVYQTAEFWF